jgi:hypothetical protein
MVALVNSLYLTIFAQILLTNNLFDMKKVFSALALTATLFAFTACGTKVCDPGYEGSDCKTALNTKFAKSYNSSGTGSNSKTGAFTINGYTQTISAPAATPGSITFSNLGNFATAAVVTAAVNPTSSKTFTITNFVDAAGRKFNGSGSLLDSNKITVNYTIYYGSDSTTDTSVEMMK